MREKLAQLMFVRLGSNLQPVRIVSEDAERVANLLGECPVGGLLLFNGNRETTPKELERLQSIVSIPLLIGADIERGIGQQLHGRTLYPHAMGFAAIEHQAAAHVQKFAERTALDARAAGVHITMSPVADVNIDPRNPIIATRAFGTDPHQVAQLVSAFIRGTQAGGLLATAKHYPGHGNTHEDSHHELPTVTADRAQLEHCELVPFVAAIQAGVPLIMTAHVCYPHLDPCGKPATLSSAILIDLLRNALGFTGAVVSDSLLMAGVKTQFETEGALATAALLAGVDILLDVEDPLSTLDALELAVECGELPAYRVDQAFSRLWKLKELAFAKPPSEAPMDELKLAEQTHRHAQQVARLAVTAFGTPGNALPAFSKSKSTLAILVRPHQSHLDPPQQPLAAAMKDQFSHCEYFEVGPQFDTDRLPALLDAAQQAEQLLVAIVVKPAAWHHFGLLPWQEALVHQLNQLPHALLACLGTPVALEKHQSTKMQLCTYSDVPVSQQALVDILLQSPQTPAEPL
jgi:beta-glucosidase-like glycosyl hydrolase